MVGATGAFANELISVVATIFPIADMAAAIGGERVSVYTVLKPGQGPHTFEPTPGDVIKTSKAEIIFRVGFGLEEWLRDMLAQTNGGERIIVDLSSAVKMPIESSGENHADHDEHHDEHHGTINPHYWLDPTNMIDVAALIRDTFIKADRSGKAVYDANYAEVIKKITVLDQDIATLLAEPRTGREVIAFHAAWEYFARRYNIVIVDVVELMPGRESSAKRFAALIGTMKTHKIKAVLVEPQISPRLGQSLAKETGATVITVDPMGGGKGSSSYFELMRFNAASFQRALGSGR
jgi:ABC-type Zn uptake system ZnuABC Zn-binding protein ZnuA